MHAVLCPYFGDLLKQSVLKECSYLVIKSQELSIKNGSQIGVGGSGEVLSAKLCKSGQGEVDVAVKCVWAIGTLGDRQRFVMVSVFVSDILEIVTLSLHNLAFCERAPSLGRRKAFERSSSDWVLLE